MKLKSKILKYDPLLEKRNLVTTIVFYGVFVMALFFSFLSTADIVDRFVEFAASLPNKYWLFDGDYDTFFTWVAYNYRKGWIFGWMIGIVTEICNYRIIRGNRDGLGWMLVSFFLISFPSLFVELEEFLYFSLSTLAGVIVYLAFLFLPKKGKMYWSICKPSYTWLRIITIVVSLVWIFMLLSSYHYFELYHKYQQALAYSIL